MMCANKVKNDTARYLKLPIPCVGWSSGKILVSILGSHPRDPGSSPGGGKFKSLYSSDGRAEATWPRRLPGPGATQRGGPGGSARRPPPVDQSDGALSTVGQSDGAHSTVSQSEGGHRTTLGVTTGGPH
eukprot:2028550-Pyramimonas_sp.AAC.1